MISVVYGEPEVNNWSVDSRGRLFKVRMLMYDAKGQIEKISVEMLNEERKIITKQDWDQMVSDNIATRNARRKKD